MIGWFFSLTGTWQIVAWVAVGITAWFLIGLPCGFAAASFSKKNCTTDESVLLRVVGYLLTVAVVSLSGVIGTGYVLMSWMVRKIRGK